MPSLPSREMSAWSIADWAWGEGIFGCGPEVLSSLVVGDKKRAGYLLYGNDLHEAPNSWAQSARHAAGLPLGARGFPWFGEIHLFFKRGCLFSLLLML